MFNDSAFFERTLRGRFREKSGETVRQNAPSSNRRCFAAQGQLERRSQSTPSHRHHPAPRASKTQPLSNCVVRACAYQSARQRNIGIAKKLAKAFDNYLAKEGCLEDPFSKQILRDYQPCVSTPKTPEQHKECVNQQNTVNHNSCSRFLSYNLGGTFH